MTNYAIFLLIVGVLFAAALSAPPPSVSKSFRPDYQYNERTDAFYKLHKWSRTGLRVQDVCAVEGATLMVPATHDDIAQVLGMLKQYPDLGNYVWVAFRRDELESLPQDPTTNDTRYFYYNEDNKPIEIIRPRCNGLARDGTTEEVPCYTKLPFVCKVDAKDAPYDPLCDVVASDYHYNATVGSCHSIRRRAATWGEADEECRKEGAHLVVLNSEAERVVVYALMKATPFIYSGDHPWVFFAGFRAEKPVGNEPAVFRTIFNETLSEAGYEGWSSAARNTWGNENCGVIVYSVGKFSDANCLNRFAFICEKEVSAQA